jgi:hypothetical protein
LANITSDFFTAEAFLILVNMSAIGSVVIFYMLKIIYYKLIYQLDLVIPGKIAVFGKLAETNAAKLEIPHIAAVAAASPTSSHYSGREFWCSL